MPGQAPRAGNRLPWLLGGAAVVALLCLVGGLAVAVWLVRDGGQEPAAVPVARPTAPAGEPAGSAAPGPAGQDEADWPALPVLPASAEQTSRASGNGPATEVAFVNTRADQVTVSWLNEDGRRVDYQVLGPGESYTQRTFVGHTWVVSGADGTAIAVFQPTAAPGRAVIS
ncbi:hypothetical protein [Actinoplanes sp. NPDC049599]|uniref:VHL beta domain-containing protein n=1 Tax=Actinoplanes sp. NPDC049599 TaxID=3363903 RepID=UPI0037A1399E